MSRESSSNLGDLARAFATLDPEDAPTRKAIATLLMGPETRAAPPSPPPSRPAQPPSLPPTGGLPARPPGQARPVELPEESAGVPIPMRIERRRAPLPPLPEWISQAPSLPAWPPPGASAGAPEPLLEPRRSRAILGALAATPGDGPIHVEAIIQAVARGEALAELPYHRVPTLARGIQLLVDRSDAMLPFHLDAEGLERELVRLTGERAEVLQFVACPSRGCGRGSRLDWTPYGLERMPRLGARILCVTDLGIGAPRFGDSPARPEEWMAFAGELRRAGCSVGALVPYPPERWPPDVGRVMELFYWDRTLTVAQAARGIFQRG